MPYKPDLLISLNVDYGDAARKYMEARDINTHDAERYLYRMKLIGKNLEYVQKMMDGTMGKAPAPAAAPAMQPLAR